MSHQNDPGLKRSGSTCGLGCFTPKSWQKLADIRCFVFIMCVVISVQGMYLGYMVGVQSALERRFEISSSEIGLLLAMYDIGHTLSVLAVGHLGAGGHKPHWTGWGVVLSAVAMLGLALPNFVYGPLSSEESLEHHRARYVQRAQCSVERSVQHRLHPMTVNESNAAYCKAQMHTEAYAILAACQFLAGLAAAPFNTVAYIYIDDNVSIQKSPFYLGLLTSMYAFGPALGFGLSALCNHFYADLSGATTTCAHGLVINSSFEVHECARNPVGVCAGEDF